jgi:copper homeostasis protein
MILVEACVADPAGAVAAVAAGATRLELCADLDSGGTTPDAATTKTVRDVTTVPIHLMVRPRTGGFCYSEAELQEMHATIRAAKAAGVEGVVLGVLDQSGQVDRGALKELVAAARPLSVTFHRAIDETPDLLEALEVVREAGTDRILTAGGRGTAVEGIPVLRELVKRAAGRVVILAGGGIRQGDVVRVVRETGVQEVHLRGGPEGEWVRGVVADLSSLRLPVSS